MRQFLLLGLVFCWYALPAQVIFPGDLNNDGRANYLDLLPLALAYGREGPPRPGASFAWAPQPAIAWPFQLPVSGVNLAFMDADGNGVIDSLDIAAIPFNYDSLQTTSVPPPQPYVLPQILPTTVRPHLRYRFDPPVAGPGTEVRLVVDYIVPPGLPPSVQPLALAFKLKINPAMILEDLPLTVLPNTSNPNLMFVAATQTSAQFWRSPQPGGIEFAVSGKGTPALAQSIEPLMEAFIIIEDMILPMQEAVQFEDTILIDNQERRIEMDVVSVRGLQEASLAGFKVFPNPADDVLYIETETASPLTLDLYTIEGHLLRSQAYPLGRLFLFSVSDFPSGAYILRLRTPVSIATQSVILR